MQADGTRVQEPDHIAKIFQGVVLEAIQVSLADFHPLDEHYLVGLPRSIGNEVKILPHAVDLELECFLQFIDATLKNQLLIFESCLLIFKRFELLLARRLKLIKGIQPFFIL